MHIAGPALLLLTLGALAGAASSQSVPRDLALDGLDPVELCQGRQVAGDAERSVSRGRYVYRFANAANRDAFAASPAGDFAIQFGGGCGAMGPLSGVGDPSRFIVHDSKIYIFASDGCRAGFLADPARCLDRPDPELGNVGGDAARKGAALLESAAVRIAGSAERFDAIRSWTRRRSDVQHRDGRDYPTGRAVTVAFPLRIRQEVRTGDRLRTDVVVGDAGFVREHNGAEESIYEHDSTQTTCLVKDQARDPIVILLSRHRPDFSVVHAGSRLAGSAEVAAELVTVAFDDTLTTLAIEPETSRIVGLAYHGRFAASGRRGDVVIEFDDFRTIGDSIELPFVERVKFEGADREPSTWSQIEVDAPLDPDCFQPPAGLLAERNVRPGINQGFLAEDALAKYTAAFETESREVFVLRHRLTRALRIQPGESMADIGAGTGLFLKLFARAVGSEGKLFAVDIVPRFVDHLQSQAQRAGLAQVEVVTCTDRSTELATASVDVAFVCDTYHHFEYPQATLASLYSAMRPGGRLFVVDFERIVGVTRQWLLDHVRAGKAVVRAEIEAAGFRFVDEIEVKGLRENYLLEFRR